MFSAVGNNRNGLLLYVFLHVKGTGTHGIASIQHLNHNVRAIQYLEQLSPDAMRLALEENGVAGKLTVVQIDFDVFI
jgi:hypothetical protein